MNATLSFSAFFLTISLFAPSAQALTGCPYSAGDTFQYFKEKFPTLIQKGGSGPDLSVSEFAVLERLDIGYMGFADEDLPYLCSLNKLKNLSIYNDQPELKKLTGANLQNLKHLSQLTYLDLDGNNITSRDLAKLALLPSLVHLKIGIGNDLSGSLEALDQFPSLQSFHLESGANLSKESLAWLKHGKKEWTSIAIGSNPTLNESVIDEILVFAQVKNLSIGGIPFKDANRLAGFADNRIIERLKIDYSSLSPAQVLTALSHIRKIPRLKSYDVRFLEFHESLFADLGNKLFLETITISTSANSILTGKTEQQIQVLLDRAPQIKNVDLIFRVMETMEFYKDIVATGKCRTLVNRFSPKKITLISDGGPALNCP